MVLKFGLLFELLKFGFRLFPFYQQNLIVDDIDNFDD
jgi:hypothetical protein